MFAEKHSRSPSFAPPSTDLSRFQVCDFGNRKVSGASDQQTNYDAAESSDKSDDDDMRSHKMDKCDFTPANLAGGLNILSYSAKACSDPVVMVVDEENTEIPCPKSMWLHEGDCSCDPGAYDMAVLEIIRGSKQNTKVSIQRISAQTKLCHHAALQNVNKISTELQKKDFSPGTSIYVRSLFTEKIEFSPSVEVKHLYTVTQDEKIQNERRETEKDIAHPIRRPIIEQTQTIPLQTEEIFRHPTANVHINVTTSGKPDLVTQICNQNHKSSRRRRRHRVESLPAKGFTETYNVSHTELIEMIPFLDSNSVCQEKSPFAERVSSSPGDPIKSYIPGTTVSPNETKGQYPDLSKISELPKYASQQSASPYYAGYLPIGSSYVSNLSPRYYLCEPRNFHREIHQTESPPTPVTQQQHIRTTSYPCHFLPSSTVLPKAVHINRFNTDHKIEPSIISSKIEPTIIPSKIEPTIIPSKIEPSIIPSKIEPSIISSKIEPSIIPSKIEPSIIPSKIEPSIIPSRVVFTPFSYRSSQSRLEDGEKTVIKNEGSTTLPMNDRLYTEKQNSSEGRSPVVYQTPSLNRPVMGSVLNQSAASPNLSTIGSPGIPFNATSHSGPVMGTVLNQSVASPNSSTNLSTIGSPGIPFSALSHSGPINSGQNIYPFPPVSSGRLPFGRRMCDEVLVQKHSITTRTERVVKFD